MFMYNTQFQYENIPVYVTQSNFSIVNHFDDSLVSSRMLGRFMFPPVSY